MDGPEELEPAHGVFQQIAAAGETLVRRYDTDPAGSVAGYVDPFPTTPTNWPVVVTQRADAGQAIYVAFGLGRYYAMRHLTHARDLMVRCIDRLLPARQIRVRAPRHLEGSCGNRRPETDHYSPANLTPGTTCPAYTVAP